MKHCRSIATRYLHQKKEDPRAFTIPYTIRLLHFTKELHDLSAIINIMPLSIYKNLGLGDLILYNAVTDGQSNGVPLLYSIMFL